MRKSKAPDITGNRYGRLTVLRQESNYVSPKGSVSSRWKCVCDCGVTKTVLAQHLLHGASVSCGCWKQEVTRKRTRHDPIDASWKLYLRHYKNGAKRRGYIWQLTDEQAISIAGQDCGYCGTPPQLNDIGKRSYLSSVRFNELDFDSEYADKKIIFSNGIDRVQNDKGYTQENVVACCTICNVAKAALTQHEWANWALRFSLHTLSNLNNVATGTSTDGRYGK